MFKFMNKCQNAMPLLTDLVVLIAAGGVIYTLWNMNSTIERVADNMQDMTVAVVEMNNEVKLMNTYLYSMDYQTQGMNQNMVNLANEMHIMNYGMVRMNKNVKKASPFSFMPW